MNNSWQKYPKMCGVAPRHSFKGTLADEWIGIEKIHGANLSIMVNGLNEFQYFRRNGVIEPSEFFYSYQEVVDKNSLNELYKVVEKSFILYGEIFGGHFGDSKHKPVQRQIRYLDDYTFIPFDLYFPDECIFMDYQTFMNTMKCTTFKILPPLIKGSYTDVASFNVENVVTTIPALFDKPLPETDHFMEGIIIRPFNKEVNLNEVRIIFKKKAKAFSEKCTNDVQSTNNDVRSTNYYLALVDYINMNRMINVCSKESSEFLENLSMSDLPKLAVKLFKDAKEEFIQENPKEYEKYLKENNKSTITKVEKQLRNHSFQVAKQYININNEY